MFGKPLDTPSKGPYQGLFELFFLGEHPKPEYFHLVIETSQSLLTFEQEIGVWFRFEDHTRKIRANGIAHRVSFPYREVRFSWRGEGSEVAAFLGALKKHVKEKTPWVYDYDPRIGFTPTAIHTALPRWPLFDPDTPFSKTGGWTPCSLCGSRGAPRMWAGALVHWVHLDCWRG